MFYLNQFLKLLALTPFRGAVFVFSNIFFIFVLSNEAYMKDLTSTIKSRPSFFYSVFMNEKTPNILREKLLNLPGILKVELETSSAEGPTFKNLSADVRSFIESEFANEKFYSLKIYLEEFLDIKSEGLLKNFIGEYSPKSFIGTTLTDRPPKTNKNFLQENIYYVTCFVALCFWLISLILCSENWKNYFFILSRSNRVSSPGMKTMGLSLTLIFMGSAPLFSMAPKSSIYPCFFMLPLILFCVFWFKNCQPIRGR